jgi:hypothetical protein
MVDFGKDPVVISLGNQTFMLLYSSERIMEYSDDLNEIRRHSNIKSTQLYYKIGKIEDSEEITWNRP